MGEVGERERGDHKGVRRSNKREFRGGGGKGQDRLLAPYTVYQREHSVGAESCGNYRARGVI